MRRAHRFVAVGLMAAMVLGIGAMRVIASDDFSDVPDSHTFHLAVGWAKDRGITGGCGGGKYCPGQEVTRGQMAGFLKNSGNVFSPTVLQASQAPGGGLDIDAQANVCETTSYTPAYEQQAYATGQVSFESTVDAPTASLRGFAQAQLVGVGTSVMGGGIESQVPSTGVISSLPVSGMIDLTPGQEYIFRISLVADEGTSGDVSDDVTNWRCNLNVMIFNRQP